ncbi:MAG: hypothetical protein ACLPX5_04965 [Dissulfurispiraceae bacterium]
MAEKSETNHTNKSEYPVTTVTQGRVPIFLPVKQTDQKLDLEVTNIWGKCVIRGCRLTQVHRNILDCIFTYHRHFYKEGDGAVAFLVNPYQLLQKLGVSPTNHTWLAKKLDELHNTIVITETSKWKIHSGIVRKHAYSKIVDNRRAATRTKFGNKLYFIVFEAEYMQFFSNDMNVHSQRLTSLILSLRHAVTQAFVRFCLTHRELNMKIDKVLQSIHSFQPTMTENAKNKIRRKIESEAGKLESDFAIKIKNGIVYYGQHRDVWFQNPTKI